MRPSSYYATFKTLAALANFEAKAGRVTNQTKDQPDEEVLSKPKIEIEREGDDHHEAKRRPDFHYNIQIHLPVTTDISVYNAIFKSLRENLEI